MPERHRAGRDCAAPAWSWVGSVRSTLSGVRPPLPTPTPPRRTARRLVPLLAVASGLAVADNYYLQPLLALIGADLGASSVAVGAVSALALLGYALGLLLVVPLGDIVDRRPLVTGILGSPPCPWPP